MGEEKYTVWTSKKNARKLCIKTIHQRNAIGVSSKRYATHGYVRKEWNCLRGKKVEEGIRNMERGKKRTCEQRTTRRLSLPLPSLMHELCRRSAALEIRR